MFSFQRFRSGHQDFVQDIAYDYYGKRMATCASDHTIRIWDQDTAGAWICTQELKAHLAAVNRLDWGSPEFGPLLASCSADRTARIFKEMADVRTGVRKWEKTASLTEGRDAITCVKFAPRHMGLKVATACMDGRVRIYESSDVMHLSVWPLVEEFTAALSNVYALAWGPNPCDAPLLAIAAQNSASIWECHPKFQKWQKLIELEDHTGQVRDIAWAPSMGRSYYLVATACKDHSVRIYKFSHKSWTDDSEEPSAASSPAPPSASPAATATAAANNATASSATTTTTATSSAAGTATVPATAATTGATTATTASTTSASSAAAGAGGTGAQAPMGPKPVPSLKPMTRLAQHKAPVWRVAWNVTGTLLASTGDDGALRLWKCDVHGGWHPTMLVAPKANLPAAARADKPAAARPPGRPGRAKPPGAHAGERGNVTSSRRSAGNTDYEDDDYEDVENEEMEEEAGGDMGEEDYF